MVWTVMNGDWREVAQEAVDEAKKLIKNGSGKDMARLFISLHEIAFDLHVRGMDQKAMREWKELARVEALYILEGNDAGVFTSYCQTIRRLLKTLVCDMQKAIDDPKW